ncbi:MAG TPA: Re/Si-specific NAD(P)(+) transhydrogenase subunit alpha [Kofleriaceae bacterium]|nr:Re/Si-specific NAD(P)(+) transhydrogenase subunit alpha [Kofleriaceae bacterium]
MTRIAIPKETAPREARVAITPDTAARLVKKGFEVSVQRGAGQGAQIDDGEYAKAGARLEADAAAVWRAGDVVVKVRPPSDDEVAMVRQGQTVISLLYPLSSGELVRDLAARGATALAADMVPRTTAAQMMDVLSSQATIAGYRAVLIAADALPKFFPMLMTAAGTISPARVLVLGAGVAGLQAIATARRLGAVVEAFDVRKAAKEQVESLGAKFIEVPSAEDAQTAGGYAKEVSEEYKQKQAALLLQALGRCDAVITTALIPGKRAPVLITAEMVRAMKRGSVIVDMAAEQGGNCALTRPGQRKVTDDGVVIIGELDLASQVAVHASQMYSRNMEKLLLHVSRDGALVLAAGDEIVKGMLIIRDGVVVHDQVAVAAAKKELAA